LIVAIDELAVGVGHGVVAAGVEPLFRLTRAQLIEAMRVSTGSSRSLGTISRRLSQPAPRLTVPEAKAPRQDLRSKDRELALEMAEAVAANVPLARIMAELEEASPYSALSALIGR